ncbi:MAG: hypothetical protein K0S39_2945, partial [Paenibacillus sp.]|nr:hypothetical protein [Paenibacillus sp.]
RSDTLHFGTGAKEDYRGDWEI